MKKSKKGDTTKTKTTHKKPVKKTVKKSSSIDKGGRHTPFW